RTVEMVAMADASKGARLALAQTRPTMFAGIVAALEFVTSFGEAYFDDEDGTREFLISLLRAARAMDVPAASQLESSNALADPATAPDPIFVAMECYRQAEGAFLTRCDLEDRMKQAGTELVPALGEKYRTPEMVALVEAARAARRALARTVPT